MTVAVCAADAAPRFASQRRDVVRNDDLGGASEIYLELGFDWGCGALKTHLKPAGGPLPRLRLEVLISAKRSI